nr:immunoglobulin light chain junction region [Macaca mulatta]
DYYCGSWDDSGNSGNHNYIF